MSNVVSSLAATSAMVGTFKEKHIAPMVDQAGKTIVNFRENRIAPVLDQAGKTMNTFKEEGLIPGLVEIKDTATSGAKAAGSWAYEHPFQTAGYALNVATFVSPGLVAGPLVYVAGFGTDSIRAGGLFMAENYLMRADRQKVQ